MHADQPAKSDGLNNAFTILYFVLKSHACCLTVFPRRHFGSHAFGVHAFAAMLMILVYATAMESKAMTGFFFVWLFALFMQRRATAADIRRGQFEHSRFGGASVVSAWFPFVRNEGAANRFDAVLCFVIGMLLLPVSQPLGMFVMAGFLSILGSVGIEQEIVRGRVRAMRDAEIEMRQMAERYRGFRDDL